MPFLEDSPSILGLKGRNGFTVEGTAHLLMKKEGGFSGRGARGDYLYIGEFLHC